VESETYDDVIEKAKKKSDEGRNDFEK